jgi:hypothetical protein
MVVHVIVVCRRGASRALVVDERFKLIEELDAGSDLVRQAIEGLAPVPLDRLRPDGVLPCLSREEAAGAAIFTLGIR